MHYIVLYPQNGDRIVTIDSVTSLHAMYTFHIILLQSHFICIQLSLFLQLCGDDELYGRLAKGGTLDFHVRANPRRQVNTGCCCSC